VGSIINTLERKGWVEKSGDLKRKNLIRITLTPEGRKACLQARKILPQHKIMGSLSEEEQKQLKSILDVIFDKARKEAGYTTTHFPRHPTRMALI
jgi:DNA-binding MarR family transcriptional regulator